MSPEKNERVREQNRELIEDLTHGCCHRDNYCTLKEVMVRSPRDARSLVLIKCIEKLKYERGHAEHREIDWNEAFHIWVDEGYADRFAKLYRVGIRVPDLYQIIVRKNGT